MKLSEMRELLSSRGIQLTKSLGQNFLHDANQLHRIVNLADLKPDDRVLEIGPGLGPLTELLLQNEVTVLAIEKDHRLCQILRERFANKPRLELLHADALEFLRNEKRDWRNWKLVSNLPYSVASPILVELARSPHPPAMLVVTLQIEVAQRIVAKAGDENYGQLSLFLQICYQPGEWFKIPAGSFFPSPDVDSACIQLQRRSKPLLTQKELPLFYSVVKKGFSERRKIMMKLLKTEWPVKKLDRIYSELGIAAQARAESLPLETFIEMTKRLSF